MLALTRVLHTIMPRLVGLDLIALALVAIELLVVAFLACLVPARRAKRVDPLESLRAELRNRGTVRTYARVSGYWAAATGDIDMVSRYVVWVMRTFVATDQFLYDGFEYSPSGLRYRAASARSNGLQLEYQAHQSLGRRR